METNFTDAQRKDPAIRQSEAILRSCVHYGFCTNTCPTYVLTRDENESPRGRIDLIREMLESGAAPDEGTVRHLDNCLSCLSCMTTCAAKVDYHHLIDNARVHIERTYRRPLMDRLFRQFVARVLPYPRRISLALRVSPLGRFVRGFDRRLDAMMAMRPKKLEARPDLSRNRRVYPASGAASHRVVLLTGCVQRVVAEHLNRKAISLLTRHGVEVVVLPMADCCGALTLHMGYQQPALANARTLALAIADEHRIEPLDAIVITASGCGTTLKDYAHILAGETDAVAEAGRLVGRLSRDITEFLLDKIDGSARMELAVEVAYHDACSLQHGQRVVTQPRDLLRRLGFGVRDVPERHFCCGSAGTYNILNPGKAEELGRRKAGNIDATGAMVVAAGNLGCMTQIGLYSALPVVHTLELLDWATGGDRPEALSELDLQPRDDDVAPDASAGNAPPNETDTFW